jgi:CBS domain-containing protein
MTVQQAYSENATSILDTQTLADVATLFVDANCSDLMIIQEDQSFVGICSEGDLIRKTMFKYSDMRTEGLSRDEMFEIYLKKSDGMAKTTVMDIATTNPITITRDTPLAKAASYMVSKNIRRLPVVEDGKLIGVLSRALAVKAIFEHGEK